MERTELAKSLGRRVATVGLLLLSGCATPARAGIVESLGYTVSTIGGNVFEVKGNGWAFEIDGQARAGLYDINERCQITGISNENLLGSSGRYRVVTDGETCLPSPNQIGALRQVSYVENPSFKLTQVSANLLEVHGKGWSWENGSNEENGLREVAAKCPVLGMTKTSDSTHLVVTANKGCAARFLSQQ